MVERQAYDTCLLGQSLQNGLANPPYGITDKLKTTCLVKLLRSLDKSEVSLVDEVGKAKSLILILLCYRYYEAEVGTGEFFQCSAVAFADAPVATYTVNKTVGCGEQVTSPTYTIVNEYLTGRMPLFHFDMYRLKSADDLWDIGWDDYLERGGVCAVEWSENVEDAMEDAIYVTIEKTGIDSRRITIEGGVTLADLSL